MKIVNIFANKLFALQYENEKVNELYRLLNLWNNTNEIYKFLKDNKNDISENSINLLVDNIIEDANIIDDLLFKFGTDSKGNFNEFFVQLNNLEGSFQILSLRKGRRNYLRIYALKIDNNCFIITGGAIKLTHLMKEREHTQKELLKLENARQYLIDNGVFDLDSFYEFLNEHYDK